MYPFQVQFPTHIYFGVGELARVGTEARALGTKALLVTGGQSAKSTGLLAKVEQLLQEANVPYQLFDQVEPNPRTSTVDRGGQLARETNCDFVIALGGGSVMDAAKAIAAVALSGRSSYEYLRGNPQNTAKELVPVTEALPLLTIPTVAATGSEANNITVLTHWETHEKSSFSGPALFPKVAILDPSLTYTVPARVTAESSADIFSHLFEEYLVGPNDAHVQDGVTEALIRLVVEFSTVAMTEPDNEEARSTLLWASTLGISPFARAGRNAGYPLHKIEHPLSGHFDMSHGRGLAILSLPYFEQFVAIDRPERLARLGRECFRVKAESDQDAAQATIQAIAHWYQQMGITQRLSDFGISRDDLPVLAREAIRTGGGIDHIPSTRALSTDDVLRVYEACF
ncbi:butanol dehydrogenase [Brevibacillus laterosporus]|uniref:iron-containing alcohol dehydrogenase n=1 Tax=Brevibacillus laterosporus TaxID=1465 RepID=UPI000C79300D|nr:iron-containing alcohol dehydrogenase [Brevibacillus laterosporus]AUM63485.1 butanol dehydrogenase [Brevibacillus laterosporus]